MEHSCSDFCGDSKTRFSGFSGTTALTSVWLAFIYLFSPNEIGTIATAVATACLIALIQARYKR
jgi:hypothetical protein